jgi:hypothetical protein
LLEIIAAGNTSCSFSSLLNGGKEKADEHANNGDDDQKFNQRKTRGFSKIFRLHYFTFLTEVMLLAGFGEKSGAG